MNIQQEFSCNYPQLLYIEHKYLENNQIGVSYVYLHDRCVARGVKIFDMKNGAVLWKKAVRTCGSWSDVNQKER